jgi:hypothetical protein
VLNLLLDPGNNPDKYTIFDSILTGLIISSGTEGVNSILKFLKFKKEETKNEAARTASSNAEAPTKAVLDEMNKK